MTDEAILKMVERELKKQPDISSADLQEKVAKKHESVRELSTRQFHARYPLRVKRQMAGSSGRRKSTKRTTKQTTKRKTARSRDRRTGRSRGSEATREVLLQFAQELVDLGTEPSFKDVLARVDQYTDKLAR